MKIITHEEMMGLSVVPAQFLNWVKQMIAQKDHTVLKPKISLKYGEEGFYNTMPAILPCEEVAGVKVVNRYPKRKPALDSQILLYDLQSGAAKAIMDGNYITTMRTGAVAAYSVSLLAKKDFEEIGLIGLGNTARATFEMLMECFPKRKFRVKLKRYKSQHEDFIERFSAFADRIEFIVCDSYTHVVENSDVVISSVTYARENFCADKCFKPGCLVVPVHTRGFQNCDLFFDKVYGDDRGHIEGFQYFSQFRSFAELSDVVTGKEPGRTSQEQRILAYNIGLAIHDVYIAENIYRMIDKKQTCETIMLNQLHDKFWA